MESTRQFLENEIKGIIIRECATPVDETTLEASLADDLGLDSIERVELVMFLEEKYSVDIDDDEVEKCATVKDLVDYIERLLKDAQRTSTH